MRLNKFSDVTFLFISLTLTSFSILLIFKLCDYGFDFTDEGYYLLSAKYANELPYKISYFDHLSSFLFNLFHENISFFRRGNIIFTLLIGINLTYICFSGSSIRLNFLSNDRFFRFSIIFLIASNFLNLISKVKIITPSYNSYSIHALILIASAIFLNSRDKFFSFFKTFLLVSGLIILILSKLTSAFAVILICLLYSQTLDYQNKKIIYISLVLSLMISIFIILSINNYSIHELFFRLKRSLELYDILKSNHSIRGMQTVIASSIFSMKFIYFICLILWTLSNFLILKTCNVLINKKKFDISFALKISPLLIVFIFPNNEVLELGFYFSLPIALFLITLYTKEYRNCISKQDIYQMIFILALPFCFVLGTNTNYFVSLMRASTFILLASFLYVLKLIFIVNKNKLKRNLKKFLIYSSLISSLFIYQSIVDININPYRQTPNLLGNNDLFAFGPSGSKLLLSKEFYSYLENISSEIQKNGFIDGTYIFDLTGRSPGLIYALGGKPILMPWIQGSYDGSNKFAQSILSEINCKDLMKTWIITETGSRYAINPNILNENNIDIKNELNYNKVLEINFPNLDGNSNQIKQTIYKPIYKGDQNLCLNNKNI